MLMKENVLVLRKYTLKYCEVKGHDVQVNSQIVQNHIVYECVCVCGTRLWRWGGEKRERSKQLANLAEEYIGSTCSIPATFL